MRRKRQGAFESHQCQIIFVCEKVVLGMHNFLGDATFHIGQPLLDRRKVILADSYPYLRCQQTESRQSSSIDNNILRKRNGDYLLVDAMTRGGDPILVEHRTAAPVSAREAEKRRPTHGHLPGPSAERRVLAADDPCLWSWE